MSNLLIEEPPLVVSPSLAKAVGLNEALFLQQIQYWLHNYERSKNDTHFINGRWWAYNSYEGWLENFPFWSESTLKRTIKKLRGLDIIYVENHNNHPGIRTNWYSINYEAIENLNVDKSNDSTSVGIHPAPSPNPPNDQAKNTQSDMACNKHPTVGQIEPMTSPSDSLGQIDPITRSNRPSVSVKLNQSYKDTETTTETTFKKYIKNGLESDFNKFWDSYPLKVAKGSARKSFEVAMKETDLDTILKAVNLYTKKLEREETPTKFYVHPSRWLDRERWLDDDDGTTAPESFEFKERYGVDKKICDEIIEKKGEPYFQSWIEATNVEFIETGNGCLKILTDKQLSFNKIINDCQETIGNFGYRLIVPEIVN